MDACFICLEPCSNGVCTQCSCRSCPACWNKYRNNHRATSSEEPLRCPVCRTTTDVVTIRTRSTTFKQRRAEEINHMRRLLTEAESHASLTPAKAKIVHAIFSRLCSLKGTDINLLSTPAFSEAVSRRLKHAYFHEGFSGAAGYYTRLFDTAITAD